MYPYNRRRRGKSTRPFMPVQGKRYRPRQSDAIKQVGAEPMIDDSVENSLPDAEEIRKLEEERDSYLDMARRERADFDNYRKRMEREMQSIKRQSLAGFLKEFFGPLDDLARVLEQSATDQSYDSLVQGVRITEENLWRVLAKAGVKRIDAKGKPFDPAQHEAMAAIPSADVPPNTVLEVYDNGYKLDDFVLRPARVVVSKAAEGN